MFHLTVLSFIVIAIQITLKLKWCKKKDQWKWIKFVSLSEFSRLLRLDCSKKSFLSCKTNQLAISGNTTELTVKPKAHDSLYFSCMPLIVTQHKAPMEVLCTEMNNQNNLYYTVVITYLLEYVCILRVFFKCFAQILGYFSLVSKHIHVF